MMPFAGQIVAINFECSENSMTTMEIAPIAAGSKICAAGVRFHGGSSVASVAAALAAESCDCRGFSGVPSKLPRTQAAKAGDGCFAMFECHHIAAARRDRIPRRIDPQPLAK